MGCVHLFFFLSLIIKPHIWEQNYLSDTKYSETYKKAMLAVEEIFKKSNPLSGIAWLPGELFFISVALLSILVTLVLFQSPAHIPEVSWTFLAPSRVCRLQAQGKTVACGWPDIANQISFWWVVWCALTDGLASRQNRHMLRLHGNVRLSYMCLLHWYPHRCLELNCLCNHCSYVEFCWKWLLG